jgi:hypothetical protein
VLLEKLVQIITSILVVFQLFYWKGTKSSLENRVLAFDQQKYTAKGVANKMIVISMEMLLKIKVTIFNQ